MIQNAHDALFPEIGADQARIEIGLIDDDGPFGALYVANDGVPFSESNFLSLSRLGQSDKDPQNSIGNKGIGFRSVLGISAEPQIFSRMMKSSDRFDGFCFGFSPKVITELRHPMLHTFRRLVTRWEYHIENFLGFVQLGCLHLLLRHL